MRPKHIIWLSVGLACVLCTAALLWQRNQIHSLRVQVESPQPSPLPAVSGSSTAKTLSSIPASAPKAAPSDRANRIPLDEILASVPAGELPPTLELLEACAGYTVEELFAAIEELAIAETNPQQARFFYFKEMLLLAACEVDPQRILAMADAGRVDADRARERAFAAIVADDVPRARKLLAECVELSVFRWDSNVLNREKCQ